MEREPLSRIDVNMTFRRNSKLYLDTNLKDVLSITSSETNVLRPFSLSRINRDSNGKFFIQNGKLKGALLILIVSVVQCTHVILDLGILDEADIINNKTTRYLTQITFSVKAILLLAQFVSAIVTVARRKPEDIIAYYESLQEIDEILFTSRSEQRKDKRQCDRAFFGVTVLRLLTRAVESFMWGVAYGFKLTGLIWLDTFVIIPVDLNTMDYFTSLILIRNRMIRLQESIVRYASGETSAALLERTDERNAGVGSGPAHHPIDNFTLCYYLLYVRIWRINNSYGFQAVVMQLANLFHWISSIHFYTSMVSSATSETHLINLIPMAIGVIAMLQSMAMICLGVTHIMSIRTYTALMIITGEKCAVDPSLGEAQRTRWARLVALCRRRPAEFTAGGFFKLDYTLLASMLGAMVTYTVTLIQTNQLASNNSNNISVPTPH